jgi:hypothetical protein
MAMVAMTTGSSISVNADRAAGTGFRDLRVCADIRNPNEKG